LAVALGGEGLFRRRGCRRHLTATGVVAIGLCRLVFFAGIA